MSHIYVMWIPIIAWSIIAIAEAYFDARRSMKGKKIFHGLSAAVRIILTLSFSLFGIEIEGVQESYVLPIKLIYTVILLIAYWITFDPFFNLFKHGKDRMWIIHEPDPEHGAVTDKVAFSLVGQDGRLYLRTKASILLFLWIIIYMLMTL